MKQIQPMNDESQRNHKEKEINDNKNEESKLYWLYTRSGCEKSSLFQFEDASISIFQKNVIVTQQLDNNLLPHMPSVTPIFCL